MPADATGEEAELRRGFFDRTGMYLLFSDTLVAQEVNAVSAKKEKVYIKVHLEWNMVSTNSRHRFFYLLSLQNLGGEEDVDRVCRAGGINKRTCTVLSLFDHVAGSFWFISNIIIMEDMKIRWNILSMPGCSRPSLP